MVSPEQDRAFSAGPCSGVRNIKIVLLNYVLKHRFVTKLNAWSPGTRSRFFSGRGSGVGLKVLPLHMRPLILKIIHHQRALFYRLELLRIGLNDLGNGVGR